MITIDTLNDTLVCDKCYQSAYSDKKLLKYITKSDATNFILYRCPKCGSYWEVGATSINIINKSQVKESYNLRDKLNTHIKLMLVFLYIVVFYYAWAKFEVVGALVTIASYSILVLDMNKK